MFSLNNATFHVFLTAAFGLPAKSFASSTQKSGLRLLAFNLGPMTEELLHGAMLISTGDPPVLGTRPISVAVILFQTAALLAIVLFPTISKKHEETLQGEGA